LWLERRYQSTRSNARKKWRRHVPAYSFSAGLLVLPGGVDVHTHLDWEFGASRTVDTFATGTKAAAFGGTTTVIDFCNQNRGESPLVGLEDWHRRRANACVDVGAHMILSQQFVEAFPWDGAASLFGARQ